MGTTLIEREARRVHAEPGAVEVGGAGADQAAAGGAEAGSGAFGRLLRRRFVQGVDAGLATAEYAIATVAAAGFAGLLITVLRSNAVRDLLTAIVKSALSL